MYVDSLKNILFVYINLDHRTDRRFYMESLLTSMNLNYVRFPAIKPTFDSLTNGEHNPFYIKSEDWMRGYLNSECDKKRKKSIGQFGCYISHYKILEHYCQYYESIVVLEDDVNFNIRSLKKYLKDINSYIKLGFDLDVSRPKTNPGNFDPFIQSHKNIYRFKSTNGSKGIPRGSKYVPSSGGGHYFYGYTHFVAYHSILNALSYLNGENVYNIDACLSTNQINSVMVIPSDIWQGNFGSDIQTSS